MEKLEITLKSRGNISADCTTAYDVRLSRDCTLGEFIRAVLTTYTKEWGTIRTFCKGDCEYSAGKVLKSDFDYSTLEQMVDTKTIKASGGWGSMNYYVTLR